MKAAELRHLLEIMPVRDDAEVILMETPARKFTVLRVEQHDSFVDDDHQAVAIWLGPEVVEARGSEPTTEESP